MNSTSPTGLLMVVLGLFIAGRLFFKDSAGETLAGRLAGGQPSSLQGANAVGQTGAEGTVTSSIPATGSGSTAQPAGPIITSKGGGALNSRQLTFANTLASLTGLNIAVVKGWLTGEEPASTTEAPNGANNWLNIGATGTANYGGANPVWDNPKTAAQATAAWLKGQPIGAGGYTSTGYAGASSGIRAILSTVGQSIGNQVSAIQQSGWAKGGYPSLPSLVSRFL